jgi:hypothetical protein
VSVLSEARHRWGVTRHVAVVGELSTHGADEGRVVREEANVVNFPNELMFVSELNVAEGSVFFVEQEIRTIRCGAGPKGAASVGLRKGCVSVFDVVFVCVYFEVGVSVGCGVAYCPRDECVGLGLGAYIYT